MTRKSVALNPRFKCAYASTCLGYKSAFSVPRTHQLDIFQTNTHISNLGGTPDCNVVTYGSTPEIDFGTCNFLVIMGSMSHGHVIKISAVVKNILYFVLASY